jgi:hypothetical protein
MSDKKGATDLNTTLKQMEIGEVVSYQALRQFKGQDPAIDAKMAEMEAVMMPILEAPNNVDIILEYGSEPMKKLE